jgi:hypothetical protein
MAIPDGVTGTERRSLSRPQPLDKISPAAAIEATRKPFIVSPPPVARRHRRPG